MIIILVARAIFVYIRVIMAVQIITRRVRFRAQLHHAKWHRSTRGKHAPFAACPLLGAHIELNYL